MEQRRLGRTGHASSVAVLGGAAFSRSTPEEAAAPFADALTAGVNHIDIAPRYGIAEAAIGPHLPAVRDTLFVGCKTTRANPDGVRQQLEASLATLQTDHVDLYQLHAVTDRDELDRRSAAVEAIFRARDEGLTRFVGITGHDLGAPAAHLEALRRYDLDTVMFPIYPRLWADPVYRADAEALLEACQAADVGVMIIKAAARQPWSATGERTATSWYEPAATSQELQAGIDFALSTPGVHAFCTPGDVALLPRALDAAAHSRPMSAADREAAMRAQADLPLIFPMPR
jgi:aryl-alcohol dehydrogenase-like predicted oxidoreductase